MGKIFPIFASIAMLKSKKLKKEKAISRRLVLQKN